MNALIRHLSAMPLIVVTLVATALAFLPVAVWLDLRSISDHALNTQASDLSSIISDIRSYYARNVVARVLNSTTKTELLSNYHDVEGAIPIPATMSIELGQVISAEQNNIGYRFVSDFPFGTRLPHTLDAFEITALEALRASRDPEAAIWENHRFDVQPADPHGDADRHGRDLRRLSQQPSLEPQNRLASRRHSRHPGSRHRPVDRHQYFLVQILPIRFTPTPTRARMGANRI